MKQRTLYCDLLLRGFSSLFSCILFVCFFFFFGMRRIKTKTDVHSIRDGALEKLWGEGNFRAARIFFRYQIPCMSFFKAIA